MDKSVLSPLAVPVRVLVWKESRELVPILIFGMITFALVMLGWIMTWNADSQFYNTTGQSVGLLYVLNMFVNTLAMVIGVCAFAPERENQTAAFLGTLPYSPRRLGLTKMWFGMGLILVFALFCYVTVTLTVQIVRAPVEWPPMYVWVDQLAVPMECFFWGVACSLILRNTITSLVSAAAAMVVLTAISTNVFSSVRANTLQEAYLLSWTIRLPLLLILLGVIAKRLGAWTCDTGDTALGWWPQISKSKSDVLSTGSTFGEKLEPEANGVMLSLIWQTFRASKKWVLICWAALVLVGIMSRMWPDGSAFSVLLICSFPVFAGALTFATDQTNHQFRFFHQHGEYARKLWLARLMPIALICLGCTALGAILIASSPRSALTAENIGNMTHDQLLSWAQYEMSPAVYFFSELTISDVFLWCLLGMAVGQFFSMFVSTHIVAIAGAVCAGCLGVFWCWLVCFLGLEPWFYLFPMAVVLLFTSWWFAPRWIGEKSSWFDSIVPWSVVGLASIISLAMVGFHRAHEILPVPSNVERVGSLSQADIAQNRGTDFERKANQLRFLAKQIKPVKVGMVLDPLSSWGEDYAVLNATAEEKTDFLTANETVLSQVKSVEDYATWLPSDQSSVHEARSQFQSLKLILKLDVERQLENDDLVEAWRSLRLLNRISRQVDFSFPIDAFIGWCSHPSQTVTILERGLRELSVESTRNQILNAYLEAKIDLDSISKGETSELFLIRQGDVSMRMLQWMPWELERARRVSFYRMEAAGQQLARLESHYSTPGSRPPANRRFGLVPEYLDAARTTQVEFSFPMTAGFASASNLQLTRYIQVRIALEIYRLKEGRYPNQLTELTPDIVGESWTELPVDPFTGGPFAYSGKGRKKPVIWARNIGKQDGGLFVDDVTEVIESGPFLLPFSGGVVSVRFDKAREVRGRATSPQVIYDGECYEQHGWTMSSVSVAQVKLRRVESSE